jgi:uncharacterized membrane protein
MRYAKYLTAQSWIQHWAEHIDVLLLRLFGNQTELGAYAQMQQVVGVTFYLSVRSLDQVANATYSSEQRKPAKLQRSLLFFGGLMLGGCVIAILLIYAFIHFFGAGIFGLSWKKDILDLWWWALPLCIVRPLMWNFLISFESTGRPSLLLLGSAAGILGITLVGALVGPELIFVPLRYLRLGAGLVLVFFGWKWTKKSIIRQAGGKRAGWIQNPLKGRNLETENTTSRFSYINFAVMTKCAALETFEVALIVITIGLSSRAWFEALSGATLALALTVLLVVLHGRLQRLPDVFMKLGAGLMLLTLRYLLAG